MKSRLVIVLLSVLASMWVLQPSGAVGVPGNIELVAGGDGEPLPMSVAVDGAGDLYISYINCEVWRLSGGVMERVAGDSSQTCQYSGESGQATDATLGRPDYIAADADGDLFVVDRVFCAVRRVDAATGVITTVAGQVSTSTCGFSGDGGLATDAKMLMPAGTAVTDDEVLYIADQENCRVRKVEDGIMTTFAGAGCAAAGGDGGPATSAGLGLVVNVSVQANGDVYILDGDCAVRRVSGGTIDTVAGGGCGLGGDRLPAEDSGLWHPSSMAFDADGNLYISEGDEENQCRVRVVHGGVMYTVAGTGPLPGFVICGYNGDDIPAGEALVNAPQSLAVYGGDLYIADTLNARVRAVRGLDADGDGVPLGADVCPGMADAGQENADGNVQPLPAPYAVVDRTGINSDTLGDTCDDDDDNDGLPDSLEMGTPCGMAPGPTDPLLLDTDGDGFHDGAECVLGTDPTDADSKPGASVLSAAACGPTGDTDGDKVMDRLETCGYNTDPDNEDSDVDRFVDGGPDGCELASLNADRVVNSGDQLLLAQEILGVLGGATPLREMDLNVDGKMNSGDQLLMATVLIAPGLCL